MDEITQRNISWIKAARKDFEQFPESAQIKIRSALTVIAEGRLPDHAKPLKGLGSGVFEITLRYHTDAYRVVYAVQIENDIWVIHAFKKKSKTGIKTPKQEIEIIQNRMKKLQEMFG